jgi:phosphatidate cytidylyltransferase
LFCLAWQADNGGLLFGRLLGTTPFAHGISPKKTREGIIGAFVLSTVSGWLMYLIVHHVTDIIYVKLGLWDYLILSFIGAFFSVYSDLLESFLKRCAGVKVSPLIKIRLRHILM